MVERGFQAKIRANIGDSTSPSQDEVEKPQQTTNHRNTARIRAGCASQSLVERVPPPMQAQGHQKLAAQ